MKLLLKCALMSLVAVGLVCQGALADEISAADKRLIKKDADKANWVTDLINAAAEHDTGRVSKIVNSANFDPSMTMSSSQGNEANTPLLTLVYAASAVAGNDKSGQVLRIVLNAGANPNQSDAYGNTTLHMAVGFKHHAPLHLLLDHGADPNIRNHAGLSPLDLARTMKLDRIVKILLEGGNVQ